jgi:hypothetical protein
MLSLLTDLSRTLRGLRRSPPLVAVAVSSIALGIGVNVTIYSVVREMVLDDLSARQPGRLARWTSGAAGDEGTGGSIRREAGLLERSRGRHRSRVDRACRRSLRGLQWRPLFIPSEKEGACMNTETKTIRILTADDHALLRTGIESLVEIEPDMELVAQASTGREATDQFRRHRPDITVMDLQMPGVWDS